MQDNNKRGTEVSAKDYQKEMMKDQPFNRKQSPRAINDTGPLKQDGKKIMDDEEREMPVREVENPGQYFPSQPKGAGHDGMGKTAESFHGKSKAR